MRFTVKSLWWWFYCWVVKFAVWAEDQEKASRTFVSMGELINYLF